MISNNTHNFVWQNLLEIARNRHYYHALANRYHRRHMIIRFALALSAIVAALPLIPLIPGVITSLAGIVMIAVVVWDLVHDYGRTDATVRAAVEILCDIEEKHRSVWDSANSGDLTDTQARNRSSELQREALAVVRGIVVREDNILSEQCQADAFKVEEQRYAFG